MTAAAASRFNRRSSLPLLIDMRNFDCLPHARARNYPHVFERPAVCRGAAIYILSVALRASGESLGCIDAIVPRPDPMQMRQRGQPRVSTSIGNKLRSSDPALRVIQLATFAWSLLNLSFEIGLKSSSRYRSLQLLPCSTFRWNFRFHDYADVAKEISLEYFAGTEEF